MFQTDLYIYAEDNDVTTCVPYAILESINVNIGQIILKVKDANFLSLLLKFCDLHAQMTYETVLISLMEYRLWADAS